jgi:aspartate-semialdehyde dehydrogenase
MNKYSIAIVGANSLIGSEILRILEIRKFPLSFLRLLAVGNLTNKTLRFMQQDIPIEELTHEAFRNIDLAFFCAGVDATRHFAKAAVRDGVLVIDNSDEYRLDSDHPLVIPEVNADDIVRHTGIIVNPNSHVIPMVMALYPLEKVNHIIRVIVTTYQSVSDLDSAGINELTEQTQQVLRGEKIIPHVFSHQIAFNVLPQIDVFYESGYTKEEIRLINESRKIMRVENISISSTCVRVPVYIGHSEAVYIEFSNQITPDDVRNILRVSPGIRIDDEPTIGLYPQPINVINSDDIFVGRVRQDFTSRNGIAMWIVADNIRKGAALNMVQIAEETIRRDCLKPRN